ncbi:hypothetical protein [Tateyamaria sp.]|uniref:hypothetical protein n=1 Tax=Tateyamaria sp. TaxID=1929288 RepID=UPI0039B9D08A
MIGLDDDPVVQMLMPSPQSGPVIVASHHMLLAEGDVILELGKPLCVVFRRVGPDQSAEDWRMSVRLVLDMIKNCSDIEIELACLAEDARQELIGITGKQFALLPAPRRSREPAFDAVWLPENRRIDLPDIGTNMNDVSVNWARLVNRLRIVIARDSPPDCSDIASFAAGGGELTVELNGPAPILVIIPNGIGLGHVTRQLAVSRHLRAKGFLVRFWCYSQAAKLIEANGFEVLVRQTAKHLRTDETRWILNETEELASYLWRSGTRTVVQDADRISPAVARAFQNPKVGDVSVALVRRGMWRPGQNIGWRDTEQVCDLVLEPSDLALEADVGATKMAAPENRGFSNLVRVAPTVLSGRDEMLPRETARREIGLSEQERYCLVSLGADTLVSHTGSALLIKEAARVANVKLVWLVSPLAGNFTQLKSGDHMLRSFPASHLLNAFDGLISAAGYNSFHEALILTDLPVLFVPNQHPNLDDQFRRARFAQEQGWAELMEAGPNSTHGSLNRFFDNVTRDERFTRIVEKCDGAIEMAELIAGLAAKRQVDREET